MMKIDQNRNYYNHGSFRYLVCHCHNYRIISQEKRIKYRDNLNNVTTKNL